ncbi:unnamed protein product [Urochloa humidicola]
MAGAPAAGQVVERFRARLREEAGGGEPDAASVVRVYAEALRELTFNCKPVITELTIIAGQHATLVPRSIADAVCARVAEWISEIHMLEYATADEKGTQYLNVYQDDAKFLSPQLGTKELLHLNVYWAKLQRNLGKDLAAAR